MELYIARKRKSDGTYDAVGMTNNMPISGKRYKSIGAVIRHALNGARGVWRVEAYRRTYEPEPVEVQEVDLG